MKKKETKIIQTKTGPQEFEVVRFKTGRPPKYKSAKELEAKVDEYFEIGVRKKQVRIGDQIVEVPIPTITGLALYLGFCDRGSLYEMQEDERFTHIIKKARSFIERNYEELLQGNNVTGAIFALKNMGWKDKSEIDQNIKITETRIQFGNLELDESSSNDNTTSAA